MHRYSKMSKEPTNVKPKNPLCKDEVVIMPAISNTGKVNGLKQQFQDSKPAGKAGGSTENTVPQQQNLTVTNKTKVTNGENEQNSTFTPGHKSSSKDPIPVALPRKSFTLSQVLPSTIPPPSPLSSDINSTDPSADTLPQARVSVHQNMFTTVATSDRKNEHVKNTTNTTTASLTNINDTTERKEPGTKSIIKTPTSTVVALSPTSSATFRGSGKNNYGDNLTAHHNVVAKNVNPTFPEKTVRPEISKITADLERTLKSDLNNNAAVFFHQGNSDETDSINNYAAHHDAKWKDQTFVRTSFSNKNVLSTHQGLGRKWDVISQSLTNLVKQCTKGSNSLQVESLIRTAVLSYDIGLHGKTDFMTLTHSDVARCIATTIPIIAQHALRLPTLLAEPIPLLKANQNKTLFMTKRLVCSLLANAFFCTLPEEKPNMPDINFHNMFNTATRGDAKAEKLKCIINYFQQVGKVGQNNEKENRIISFERRCIHQKIDWANSPGHLISINVELAKKIEEAHGSLQVDFANKRVGGGVLNEGAVMEEILFAVCPELIISRLFTETLEDDEVLVITGTEQYSNYKGYSRKFQYDGNSVPVNYQVDNLGRNCNQIVVVDALHFKQYEIDTQFQENCINRELHKAYVAFYLPHGEPNISIATGNWGCGAFNGDLELKFLIQWMAASEAGRNHMIYHTIGDRNLSRAIQSMQALLMQRNVNVGQLYTKVISYHRKMAKYSSIFKYLENSFSA